MTQEQERSAQLRRGPSAGHTAHLDLFPSPSPGWWMVRLRLTDDIHGREAMHQQQEFPCQLDAQREFDKLAGSLEWAASGPIQTPITA